MTVIKASWLIGLMTLAAGAGSIATAEDGKPNDDMVKLMARDDCGGERCIAIARGLFHFFDRRLHGLQSNGRACADCHMASDSFQLSPANAEARYQALQQRRLRNPRA